MTVKTHANALNSLYSHTVENIYMFKNSGIASIDI